MYVDTKEGSSSYRSKISATPTLKSLAYLLRHPEFWPEGFEWNFRYGNCCAMGLARKVWPEHIPASDATSMKFAFAGEGLTFDRAYNIFHSGLFGVTVALVRPITVARRIERFLAWGV